MKVCECSLTKESEFETINMGGCFMKKVISIVVALVFFLILTACGKQNTLAGKYYEVIGEDSKLRWEFEDNTGKFHSPYGKNYIVSSIDTENKQFTGNSPQKGNIIFSYEQKEDGTLLVTPSGSYEHTYYKEGSKALENALYKYKSKSK